MKKQAKVIKMSCGGQGCEIKPYHIPMGIKIIPIGNKYLVRKAA